MLVYVSTLAIGIGGVYWVRDIGERAAEGLVVGSSSHAAGAAASSIATTPPTEPTAAPAKKVDVTFHVLATLATVISLGYLLSKLFRFLGQPPVIGEV